MSVSATGLAAIDRSVFAPSVSDLIRVDARTPVAAASRGAEGSSIPASSARTRESALLAADVYNDVAAPPPGFRVADADDLARLNLQPRQLEAPGSSFRARVYVTGECDATRYVVAFRGSSSGEDWRNNFQQAGGGNSESYAKALLIGERLARSDASVTIAGHSLGGGLAATAAVASGRAADTFNAAGLSDRTIAAATASAAANDRAPGTVEAWQVRGEILSHLQDGGDRVLGFLVGGIPGALLADAPSAYGNRHTLPEVVPDGKSWLAEHSRIDRHMIDWVLAGAAALR
ncbi:MAG: hypothetical protein DCF31_09495 [Alphaproteobacteria bacterium]|nr:MAG: hypothetical protein DCF31_09495 [Alphaproteobacteria bacterium]